MIVTVLTIWWVAPEKFTNKVERVKESVSETREKLKSLSKLSHLLNVTVKITASADI